MQNKIENPAKLKLHGLAASLLGLMFITTTSATRAWDILSVSSAKRRR